MKKGEQQKPHELVSRGIESVYPSKEYVLSRLTEGKKLKVYLGIDPTGPTLHLGHMIAIKKLAEFQKMGHQAILLIGDFTAMIGDPTDKLAARKQLTKKEVQKNLKLYVKQAEVFLSFKGANKALVCYNSAWLGKMKFEDVLSLASHMTVDQMLKRDMFERRMKDGQPVYIHEFMYPLMQGYDSVALDVDGEIGGNDQMFNMLVGRTLLKQLKNKEKFVMTVKLFSDSSGKKMGKTEGNMVSLLDTPFDMFGKIMSWSDGMILSGFELCTNLSLSELEEISKNISKGDLPPRDAKMLLGYEIVKIYHGEKKAGLAQSEFVKTFQKKEIPDDVPCAKVSRGEFLVDIFIREDILKSKNEFRRLLSEGAVTNAVTKEKITDVSFQIEFDTVYKIGKHRFLSVKVK